MENLIAKDFDQMHWARAIVMLTAPLLLGLTGCYLRTDREINLDIIYPSPQQSEVTVKYRVPPPPEGKVYVLWILNPDLGKQVKIGQVQPTSRLAAIRVSVDFFATGAIISIESDPDVQQLGETWALKAGQISPTAPTNSRPK